MEADGAGGHGFCPFVTSGNIPHYQRTPRARLSTCSMLEAEIDMRATSSSIHKKTIEALQNLVATYQK
jgi:hypothetical protein